MSLSQLPCGTRHKGGVVLPLFKACIALMSGLSVVLALSGPVLAAKPPLVVTNDLGGVLTDYMASVEKLRRNGTPVVIRGTCVSACTLYLGLPNACVARNARLGFHGPSSPFPGIPLPPNQFERVSRQMATYYPADIRAWFLTTARKVTENYYVLTGAEAIAMGARPCDGAEDVALLGN